MVTVCEEPELALMNGIANVTGHLHIERGLHITHNPVKGLVAVGRPFGDPVSKSYLAMRAAKRSFIKTLLAIGANLPSGSDSMLVGRAILSSWKGVLTFLRSRNS